MKIICFNLLSILILTSCSLKKHSNDHFINSRLLITPVLNDSSVIYKVNDSWSDNYSCLKLKIDTIELRHIKKIRNNFDEIRYKGCVYNKTNIFEIKDLDYLKNLKISTFKVFSVYTKEGIINYDACFSKNVISLLNSYFQPKYKEINSNTKVYFSDITVEARNGDINLGTVICVIVVK